MAALAALPCADLRALNVDLRAPPRQVWTAYGLALGVSRSIGGPDRVHVPPIAHVKGSGIRLISLDFARLLRKLLGELIRAKSQFN